MADVTALRDELDEDEAARIDDATALGKGGALNAFGAVCFALLGFALVTIITRSLGARGAGAFLEAGGRVQHPHPRPRCWVPTSAWCASSPATGASTASLEPAADVW